MGQNMSWRASFVLAAACFGVVLGGCSTVPPENRSAFSGNATDGQKRLNALPPPARKVVVAVYDYPDLTGQFRPSDNVQTLSRAVSQGSVNLVITALQEAGYGAWFTVVEREALDALLRERAIIRDQRQNFLGSDGKPLPPPPPLIYAGILLDGGIIGYDTNTVTGGLGARYLGIGASTQYRQDTVTVYLRATSTQTGEILKTVHASKTIASYAVSADVFKFLDFRELAEGEVGFARNEPGLLALRRAIEEAVLAMIIEGAQSKLWSFADANEQERVLREYEKRNDIDPREVRVPTRTVKSAG